MAGILNKKERMLDLIVTSEGRRQAAVGQLKIAYATFTDMHTFYRASGSAGVAEQPENRIFFEATNRYQDIVVPELQPGNSLRPFRTSDFVVQGKTLVSGSFRVGFITRGLVVSGSKIKDAADPLLRSITSNFTQQRILSTFDPFNDTSGFNTNITKHDFTMARETIFSRCPPGKDFAGNTHSQANLDAVPSLFRDKRFAHFPNFDYLPPVNLPSPESTEGVPLAKYANLSEEADRTYDDIKSSLDAEHREFFKLEFGDTSRDNNLVAQMFEFSRDGVEKLSIIDAGEFDDGDPLSPGRHVYYIGKMKLDSTGAETFFNIFTVVFD